MALGRRKVRLEEQSAWVFNRMADVYPARPEYPGALIDALAELAGTGRRVLDLGAGIGHLALPLAARGFEVVALEPARAMLDVLTARAEEAALSVRTVHGTAESIPLPDASFDLVVVGDALHFLDAELAGREVGRVLCAGGGLGLVGCTLADTPYMQSVVRVMEEAAPRRPRVVTNAARQFFKMAGVAEREPRAFADQHSVDLERLERILRSVSFIGPAMNPERFAAFSRRIRELPGKPHWARTFELRSGQRR